MCLWDINAFQQQLSQKVTFTLDHYLQNNGDNLHIDVYHICTLEPSKCVFA